MEKREAFVVQLSNQPLVPGDAIVLLQGDGLNRVAYAAQLYKEGYATFILLVGGDTRREYGSYPSSELKEQLIIAGIPEEAIFFEETAAHTHAEAVRALELAKEHSWKNILIVTSPHHIFRAFLTFLAVIREQGPELILQPAPVRDLPWFYPNAWGRRADLLEPEFNRIDEYRGKGHVASFEDGIAYLEWKESKL